MMAANARTPRSKDRQPVVRCVNRGASNSEISAKARVYPRPANNCCVKWLARPASTLLAFGVARPTPDAAAPRDGPRAF